MAGEEGENVEKRLFLLGFGMKREDHNEDENAILFCFCLQFEL